MREKNITKDVLGKADSIKTRKIWERRGTEIKVREGERLEEE